MVNGTFLIWEKRKPISVKCQGKIKEKEPPLIGRAPTTVAPTLSFGPNPK